MSPPHEAGCRRPAGPTGSGAARAAGSTTISERATGGIRSRSGRRSCRGRLTETQNTELRITALRNPALSESTRPCPSRHTGTSKWFGASPRTDNRCAVAGRPRVANDRREVQGGVYAVGPRRIQLSFRRLRPARDRSLGAISSRLDTSDSYPPTTSVTSEPDTRRVSTACRSRRCRSKAG